jgi:hypothetical protein
MQYEDRKADDLQAAGEGAITAAADELRALLAELAGKLRPFPSFMNLTSVQAVELDPPLRRPEDRGCVVVLPTGEICEFNLTVMPGVQGVMDMDQVEEFQELDLPPEEYIMYAATAVRLLARELRRRE